MKKPKKAPARFIDLFSIERQGVAVLFVLVIVLFAVVLRMHKSDRNFRLTTTAQLDTLSQQVIAEQNASHYTHVAISTEDNTVRLPELRLLLPYSGLSSQIVYDLRDTNDTTGRQETDIDTAADAAYVASKPERLACVPIRLAFETKANPYSPSESSQTSVHLADGRTMQIYVFHDGSCNDRWQLMGVDTKGLAAAFTAAKSY